MYTSNNTYYNYNYNKSIRKNLRKLVIAFWSFFVFQKETP